MKIAQIGIALIGGFLLLGFGYVALSSPGARETMFVCFGPIALFCQIATQVARTKGSVGQAFKSTFSCKTPYTQVFVLLFLLWFAISATLFLSPCRLGSEDNNVKYEEMKKLLEQRLQQQADKAPR